MAAIRGDAVGVTHFSVAGSLPRPHLAIVGAIHGNEHCGLSAITRLSRELANETLRLQRGTLSLVHGNPQATLAARRHTVRGVDLNRVFDYRFVDELAPDLWGDEHRRAHELRPLFERVDAVLDLHSTSAPSDAFAISSRVKASEALALDLDLDFVTFGWDGRDLLGDQVLLSMLTRRALPGVAVECGQHDDPTAPEIAYQCALRALAHFGLIAPFSPARAARRLVVTTAVKRTSASFRFARPLRGLEPLGAGTLLGYDDQLALSVRQACRVIMPNEAAAIGEDLAYLATEQT